MSASPELAKFFPPFQSYQPTPWRDSIPWPIAPVSSVAGRDNTTTYVGHAARAELAKFTPIETTVSSN
jgi:hypothetical protein